MTDQLKPYKRLLAYLLEVAWLYFKARYVSTY